MNADEAKEKLVGEKIQTKNEKTITVFEKVTRIMSVSEAEDDPLIGGAVYDSKKEGLLFVAKGDVEDSSILDTRPSRTGYVFVYKTTRIIIIEGLRGQIVLIALKIRKSFLLLKNLKNRLKQNRHYYYYGN